MENLRYSTIHLVAALLVTAACSNKGATPHDGSGDHPSKTTAKDDDDADAPVLDCVKDIDGSDVKGLFAVPFTAHAVDHSTSVCELAATKTEVIHVVITPITRGVPIEKQMTTGVKGAKLLPGVGDETLYVAAPNQSVVERRGGLVCIIDLSEPQDAEDAAALTTLDNGARVKRLAAICDKLLVAKS